MIARLLYKLSGRLPCKIVRVNGRPHFERYYIGQLCGWTFHLHRFLARDGDRGQHDHPWSVAVGIPLTGWYRQLVVQWLDPLLGPKLKEQRIGWLRPNILTARTVHQITYVAPNTWTLFAHRPHCKEWAFMSKVPDAHAIVYEQSEAVLKNSGDWHKTNPIGWRSKREPFRPLGDYDANYARCHVCA